MTWFDKRVVQRMECDCCGEECEGDNLSLTVGDKPYDFCSNCSDDLEYAIGIAEETEQPA